MDDKLEDVPVEKFKEIIDVNLLGTFLAIKWGIRAMKANTEVRGTVTGRSLGGHRACSDCPSLL
jgi:NAD(P)-dependent dehydrogenase (short-subunit alcohol dehydrogenase family)